MRSIAPLSTSLTRLWSGLPDAAGISPGTRRTPSVCSTARIGAIASDVRVERQHQIADRGRRVFLRRGPGGLPRRAHRPGVAGVPVVVLVEVRLGVGPGLVDDAVGPGEEACRRRGLGESPG